MDRRQLDAELVRRFRQEGDEAAFLELVETTERAVHLVALSVLGRGGEADAEDVTQEVFLAAYTRLSTLRDGQAFSSWVRRAAYNRAVDLARRRRFRAPIQAEEIDRIAPDRPTTPLTDTLDRDRGRRIAAALAELPPTYRSCIHLVYWLGCTVAETSRLLDLPEGTVKSYLYRARARLRTSMGDLHDDD